MMENTGYNQHNMGGGMQYPGQPVVPQNVGYSNSPPMQSIPQNVGYSNSPPMQSVPQNVGYVTGQQPVVVADVTPNIRTQYPQTSSIVLGILQIFCGVVSIILNIVSFPVDAYYADVGYGFWCGIPAVFAGALGIAAGKVKSRCLIISHMVMSIISAIFIWTQIPLSIDAAVYDGSVGTVCTTYLNGYKSCQYYVEGGSKADMAVDIILLLCGVLEFVVAIWSASMSCRYECCLCCKSCCCVCYRNDEVDGRRMQPVTYAMQQPSSGAAVQYRVQNEVPAAVGYNNAAPTQFPEKPPTYGYDQ